MLILLPVAGCANLTATIAGNVHRETCADPREWG